MAKSFFEYLSSVISGTTPEEVSSVNVPDSKVKDHLVSQLVSTLSSDMRMLSGFMGPYDLAHLMSDLFDKLYSESNSKTN